MAAANSYEELRRRQVGVNNRKLEELRLPNLSAAVHQAAAKPSLVRLTLLRDKRSSLFSALLLTLSGLLDAADQYANSAAVSEAGAGRPDPAVGPHYQTLGAARLRRCKGTSQCKASSSVRDQRRESLRNRQGRRAQGAAGLRPPHLRQAHFPRLCHQISYAGMAKTFFSGM